MIFKGSFEDFIYILIGIIWIAFSIFQGQKKKRQKSSQPTTQKKKSFFETLLDEVAKENQQEEQAPDLQNEIEPVPSKTAESTISDHKFSYDDYYEERNYDEAEEAVIERGPIEKTPIPNKLKPQAVKRRKIKFDLRKAVIYSEILKPRYF
jgi:hypothetical protein